MKKLIWICILFPFSLIQAEENVFTEADIEFAQYYYSLNSGDYSPYREGKVAFFEKGMAYTALLDEDYEKIYFKAAPELDGLGIEGHFTYDASLDKIYFTKEGILYESTWKDGQWSTPQPIKFARIKMDRKTLSGSMIAYSGWRYKPDDVKVQGVYNPALSADGKKLYYAADLPGTYGGLDIWYSTQNEDGTWSEPINLGENVNSASDENIPVLQGDTSLFFASVAPQPQKVSDSGVQSDSDEKRFSNKQDMRLVPLNGDQKPFPVVTMLASRKKTGVMPEEEIEPMPALAEVEEASSKIYLKDPKTCVFLFDFDNDNLINAGDEEIDLLLEFINRYEDGKFLIVGYTDERGGDRYNMTLSEKRAKKIYQLLIKRGVPKNILQYVGKGKSNPVVKNAQTEEEHQENRRVEIQNMN